MVLAARGTREVDGGVEPVEDEAERTASRHQARAVWVGAGLFAVLGTAAILLL